MSTVKQIIQPVPLNQKLKNVSRLTVVGDDGRVLEVWGISDLKAALQDDERTLKIFYKKGNLHD